MRTQWNQPKFCGSENAIIAGNLIRQLRDQNKQKRLAEQREIQVRQQVIQELYAAGCLNGSAYLNPLVRDAFQPRA